jgi:hypothetical protein
MPQHPYTPMKSNEGRHRSVLDALRKAMKKMMKIMRLILTIQ